MGRQLRTDADSVGDRLVQVVDLDLQVHRHLRPARLGRPHRTDVVRLGLEAEVVPGVLGGRDAGAVPVGVLVELPVEQAGVKAGKFLGVRGVQGHAPPLLTGS
jgi:hypothetical protein